MKAHHKSKLITSPLSKALATYLKRLTGNNGGLNFNSLFLDIKKREFKKTTAKKRAGVRVA